MKMSLTGEDKQWIEQGRAEDRRWFEQARAEDRRSFEQLLDHRFRIERQWVEGRLEEQKRAVNEQIEHAETRLLTAFHQWASPTDARLRTHAATLRALDLEMEELDDRMKKLESDRPPNSPQAS